MILSDDFILDGNKVLNALATNPNDKLRYAARLVETAAYGLAGHISSQRVANLMLASAELEKFVMDVEAQRASANQQASAEKMRNNVLYLERSVNVEVAK